MLSLQLVPVGTVTDSWFVGRPTHISCCQSRPLYNNICLPATLQQSHQSCFAQLVESKGITLIMAIGLPVWIIISWIYDITPKGLEKTTKDSESELIAQATNKRLNVFIIVSLSIAVIVLSLNLLFFSNDHLDREYSIAVIPFKNIKVDKDNEWLSQNFTQNINTYMSKIKELKVQIKGQDQD